MRIRGDKVDGFLPSSSVHGILVVTPILIVANVDWKVQICNWQDGLYPSSRQHSSQGCDLAPLLVVYPSMQCFWRVCHLCGEPIIWIRPNRRVNCDVWEIMSIQLIMTSYACPFWKSAMKGFLLTLFKTVVFATNIISTHVWIYIARPRKCLGPYAKGGN